MLTEEDILRREYDQLRTDNAYLKEIAVLGNPGTLLKTQAIVNLKPPHRWGRPPSGSRYATGDILLRSKATQKAG